MAEPRKHLAFIHGFLEHAGMWNELCGLLSKKDYVIHKPEIPGHGGNIQLPNEHSAEAYAKNIWSQMDVLQDEKVLLIGHSMGGYLACEMAAQRPDQISGLCLFHSKAGADTEQKKQDRLRAMDAARHNKALYVRTMINALFYEPKRSLLMDDIEKQIEYATSLETESIIASLQVMMTRADHVPTMLHRRFPLFYFLGDQDPSLPPDIMEQELAMLPGAVSHIEHYVGHMGHLECTREAAVFLQRVMRISH